MKTNISASILLDDSANTQTKRMKNLEETHCPQTTTTEKKNIARDARAALKKGAKSSKGSVLSAPGVSGIFQHALPCEMPIQEHLTQCRILTVIGSEVFREAQKMRF